MKTGRGGQSRKVSGRGWGFAGELGCRGERWSDSGSGPRVAPAPSADGLAVGRERKKKRREGGLGSGLTGLPLVDGAVLVEEQGRCETELRFGEGRVDAKGPWGVCRWHVCEEAQGAMGAG